MSARSSIYVPNKHAGMLSRLPDIIIRAHMFAHLKQIGHTLIDISDDDMARAMVHCPIYEDNGTRDDIIFNNYLCSCGRLFIFIARQQPGGRTAPGYREGTCPCQVCNYFKEGSGCTWGF